MQQIRNDVEVDAFAIRLFDKCKHLDVLFEGERDVDVIDLLLRIISSASARVPSRGSPR